jgi:predicted dinucleotide-binding enzyme
VIKAFNNIYFKSLLENSRPKGMRDRIALPGAGDPFEARKRVAPA